ncbi:MAG: hypothetical protein A2000_14695 [Ignavibacteria bacterium GWB2_36_8]|nr:MAG: hypothetical protein A2000_14695 [Ignavibacteria bacterium GWB2_36_8]OGU49471.1 MAG: hypothetical protein A2080_08550 [Ignavibacteria bacterium GWC2_36_12]
MAFSFKEGDIIYLKKVPYTNHPKYQLTLNIEKELFFVINSDINNTIAINSDFKNCQVVLSKLPNHNFMPNDTSYIACHQLAPKIRCDEIEKMIKVKEAEVIGKIDEATLEKVKDTVLNYSRLTLTGFEILYIKEGLDKVNN